MYRVAVTLELVPRIGNRVERNCRKQYTALWSKLSPDVVDNEDVVQHYRFEEGREAVGEEMREKRG